MLRPQIIVLIVVLFIGIVVVIVEGNMSKTVSAYQKLVKMNSRLHNLNHLANIASWDSSANMPKKGAEARGNALAEIKMVMHGISTDPSIKGLLEEAESDSTLTPEQRSNLREIRYQWTLNNGVPDELVERISLLTSKCEHAWRTQRSAHDWEGFKVNFIPLVEATRESARILQAQLNTPTPYDALMAQYEPGQSSEVIRKLF